MLASMHLVKVVLRSSKILLMRVTGFSLGLTVSCPPPRAYVRPILLYLMHVFDLVCSAGVVSTHPSTSYFRKILTPAVINRLNETAELTIFVPVDPAWDALHPIEKLYLESEFATDDLIRIFEMHAVVQHGVKWSESFNPAINCQSFFRLFAPLV